MTLLFHSIVYNGIHKSILVQSIIYPGNVTLFNSFKQTDYIRTIYNTLVKSFIYIVVRMMKIYKVSMFLCFGMSSFIRLFFMVYKRIILYCFGERKRKMYYIFKLSTFQYQHMFMNSGYGWQFILREQLLYAEHICIHCQNVNFYIP